MTTKNNRIKRAIDRLILRLSLYEISNLGKIVKKLRRNNEKGS
jgi:hypothetical protein